MDRETRERRDALLAEVGGRPEARLELAELYRAIGLPDEAGRWGISTEGWTRHRERAAYSAQLAGRNEDVEDRLRRLSGFAKREPLNGDAQSVVDSARAAARSRRARALGMHRLTFVGLVAVLLAIGGYVLFAVIALTSLLAGEKPDRDLYLGLAALLGVVVAIALVLMIVGSALRRVKAAEVSRRES